MNDFKHMDSVVDYICHSLEDEPETWVFETYTMSKKGIKYWIGAGSDRSITKMWNGRTTDTVFSEEQGKRIRKSYNRAREIIASEAQKKVISSMKPWWHKLLGI